MFCKRVLLALLALAILAFSGIASAESTAGKGRITLDTYGHEPMKFAFYLDSEGHANYEERVLTEVIETIQAKMPAYAKIRSDGQFIADFDLFREEKYDALMKKMQETNPEFAVMASSGDSDLKVKLSRDVIDEYLQTTDYDGLVIVRIDKVQEKAGINYTNAVLFGIGGVNTKVEMDVTTRVYNKKSPNGYVFNNKQRVVGKVHGSWAPDTASRKAVPMAIKNIDRITVE